MAYSNVQLSTLLAKAGKEAIYKTALFIAETVGLPVTTWQAGDPTRSLFHLESELLATLEDIVIGYVRSGFLDYAAELAEAGDDDSSKVWLKLLAKQVFNVDVPAATAATTDVVLTNTGKRFYPDIEAGDLTFKSTITGKTYHNTSGGTLASGPGTVLTVSVEADEVGSASTAGAGEIDTLVTGEMLGVTCTNPIAAVGTDEQAPATTVQQCRDKLGSLSPNGPKEAYAYVARNADLSGTNAVTRVRVYGDSDTGDVSVYLASGSGGVTEPVRALVEAAILKWATPICITPTVLAAVNVTVPIAYTLWLYKSVNKTVAQVAAEVQLALSNMFANRPIGGDIIPPASGKLYKTMIESTIRGLYPQAFRVEVTSPTLDTTIASGQVAALGAVTPTVVLVLDP